MKIGKLVLMLAAFSFSGCALGNTSQVTTSAKTDVALMKYKKITVNKFKNPKNDSSGQEAADILAMGFVKMGFNVAGSTELAGLINQDDLNSSGLTTEIKSKLRSAGIDGIVTGTVNDYFCSRTDNPMLMLKPDENNHCSVAVTARMLDLDTGEIVWGATNSGSMEGKWVTADVVLRSIMQKMEETIPNIIAIRQAVQKAEKQQVGK